MGCPGEMRVALRTRQLLGHEPFEHPVDEGSPLLGPELLHLFGLLACLDPQDLGEEVPPGAHGVGLEAGGRLHRAPGVGRRGQRHPVDATVEPGEAVAGPCALEVPAGRERRVDREVARQRPAVGLPPQIASGGPSRGGTPGPRDPWPRRRGTRRRRCTRRPFPGSRGPAHRGDGPPTPRGCRAVGGPDAAGRPGAGRRGRRTGAAGRPRPVRPGSPDGTRRSGPRAGAARTPCGRRRGRARRRPPAPGRPRRSSPAPTARRGRGRPSRRSRRPGSRDRTSTSAARDPPARRRGRRGRPPRDGRPSGSADRARTASWTASRAATSSGFQPSSALPSPSISFRKRTAHSLHCAHDPPASPSRRATSVTNPARSSQRSASRRHQAPFSPSPSTRPRSTAACPASRPCHSSSPETTPASRDRVSQSNPGTGRPRCRSGAEAIQPVTTSRRHLTSGRSRAPSSVRPATVAASGRMPVRVEGDVGQGQEVVDEARVRGGSVVGERHPLERDTVGIPRHEVANGRSTSASAVGAQRTSSPRSTRPEKARWSSGRPPRATMRSGPGRRPRRRRSPPPPPSPGRRPPAPQEVEVDRTQPRREVDDDRPGRRGRRPERRRTPRPPGRRRRRTTETAADVGDGAATSPTTRRTAPTARPGTREPRHRRSR